MYLVGLRNSDSENEEEGDEGGEDDDEDVRGGDQSFVQDTSFLQVMISHGRCEFFVHQMNVTSVCSTLLSDVCSMQSMRSKLKCFVRGEKLFCCRCCYYQYVLLFIFYHTIVIVIIMSHLFLPFILCIPFTFMVCITGN